MSGTRFVVGRIVTLGVLLAMSVLLLAAAEAGAGKYQVAQCGWFVEADANWADTTGGAKFRQDGYCVPPPGADPFDGVHVKSFTRDGQGTVSGTRFARWRWEAPAGTAGITAVRGTWWHALHDGMEQRLGGVNWSGAFSPSLAAGNTDTALRDFSIGFGSPVAAFEDRLLCARAESKWCSLSQTSWSGMRALTLTVQDDAAPSAAITGGPLLAGGWRRGRQWVVVGDGDGGSGVRYSATYVDGNRIAANEYNCAKVEVGGEWRATAMRPCPTGETTTHFLETASLSDGLHSIYHCSSDFAVNHGCTGLSPFLIDNNPPAHPRAPQLLGGDGWRRVNDFDLVWENPDQRPGSPIAGASWRMLGFPGYDSGVHFAPGRDRSSLADLTVPTPGTYVLQVWLRDEAENEAPATAVTVLLRLDNVQPKVEFPVEEPEKQVWAGVADEQSGPAKGQIYYRRSDASEWTELATKVLPAETPGRARLVAPMPELGYGTFVFRAEAGDGAGNVASTTLRADGSQMSIRRLPPPPLEQAKPLPPGKPLPPRPTPPLPQAQPAHPKGKARLFARLRGGHGRGDSLTVPFGAAALISGRLTRADGAGLARRRLRVVSHPSHGALAPLGVQTVETGGQGGFELRLPPGPSRRVTVTFPGDGELTPARRPGLELRVRSGISLHAVPRSLRTGQAVSLSGKVRSREAPIPRRGKLVAIQYREQATGRWRPVLVTRTNHHGRFRTRYRFRYVIGTASIRLRATALAEERWPYAPGSSPPVAIKVRG
jgi:hypothetical protein